jgi:hypothetical protein
MVGQFVRLDVEPHMRLMIRFELLFDSCGFVDVGRFPDERTVCYLAQS